MKIFKTTKLALFLVVFLSIIPVSAEQKQYPASGGFYYSEIKMRWSQYKDVGDGRLDLEVIGEITNKSGKDYAEMIWFNLNFYDKNGKLVETKEILFGGPFPNGATKSFKVYVTSANLPDTSQKYLIRFDKGTTQDEINMLEDLIKKLQK